MTKHVALAALVCVAAGVQSAWAADVVRTRTQGDVRGRITEMSPLKITVDTNPVIVEVSVQNVISVRYDDEPVSLSGARQKIDAGQYDEALEQLNGINRGVIGRREVLQDLDYYTALAHSKKALAGAGTVNEGARLMLAFIQNTGNFHYLEANEVLGDLAVAAGKPEGATRFYDEAAKAPWPEAKMRVDLARGRAMLQLNRYPEATKFFQSVDSAQAAGGVADGYRQAARAGLAICLAAQGQGAQGIAMVQEILQNADKTNTQVHAMAYNALGYCHKAAGNPQEAVLAFLHTDLLYFQDAQAHAEALGQLSRLWAEVNKPQRARESLARLKGAYPHSRWAQQ